MRFHGNDKVMVATMSINQHMQRLDRGGKPNTKNQERQRALVLVVHCGAVPAVLWCDASAQGSAAACLLQLPRPG